MNKSFPIFFSSVAILRLLSILAIFCIEIIWTGDIKGSIDFELPWYEWAFIYSITISYPVNTIISLLISFRHEWFFRSFLSRKAFLLIFYIAELIMLPVFAYVTFKNIQDAFFPPERDIYTEMLITWVGGGSEASPYEKAGVINAGALVVVGILYLITFWSFYKARKKEYREMVYL